MSVSGLNEDFVDVLRALGESSAELIVVGAHAMAVHGVPRTTGDLDILVRPTMENAHRVLHALTCYPPLVLVVTLGAKLQSPKYWNYYSFSLMAFKRSPVRSRLAPL